MHLRSTLLAATILLVAACSDPEPVPAPRSEKPAPAAPVVQAPPAKPAPIPAPAPAPAPADGLIAEPAPAASAPAKPVAEGPLVQAEDTQAGAVIDAPGAEGGKAVIASGAWQPVLRMPPPPAELGPKVVLKVRHRGGPIQAKTINAGGTQAELSWQYKKPLDWTWTTFGPADAVAAAGGAIIIRGKADESPQVDCARWIAGPAPEAPTALPAQPIALTADWTTDIATAGPWAYGINQFRGFDEQVVGDARYQGVMREMDCGLLRWWTAEQLASKGSNSWYDNTAKTWKADKIGATLRARQTPTGEVLLCIGEIPAWMDTDGDHILDADKIDAWATHCAELVRLVNVANQGGVVWWEITNEWDDIYHNNPVKKNQPSQVDRHIAAYNAAAKAMKAVDPTIKTGGPAAIRPDLIGGLRLWVRGTKDQLDFYSYHAYASGDAADADARILGRRVSAIRDAVAGNVAMLREEIPGRTIPNLLDEYNISWTWQTRDPRMRDHRGVVFDALVMAVSATAGATGTTAWNEMDGIYGKMDPEFRPRPQVALFGLLNQHARGSIVRSAPSVLDEAVPVVCYAVRSAKGRCAVIISRANVPARLDGSALGFGSAAKAVRMDAKGRSELPAAEALAATPAHAVTVVWE